MKLYHFTHADVEVLKVNQFGGHSWTDNDAERNKIPRLFFYLTTKPREWFFKNAAFRYDVQIDTCKLYDFRHDPKKLRDKFNCNIPLILEYCKRHYKGVIYTSGSFDAVSLFYDVKPIKKIRRH